MPPKKQKTSADAFSSTTADIYDTERFVHLKAEKRFEKVKKRKWIRDREFAKASGESFQRRLSFKKWEKIGRERKEAVMVLVQEYYTNALFEQPEGVFVRGKHIKLDAQAFRTEFCLPTVGQCAYAQYKANKERYDYAAVCRTLTSKERDYWERENGEPKYLPRSMMIREAKFWTYFVSSNLIPIKMTSKITKERAVLIYLIMTDQQVDAGQIMANSLKGLVTNASAGLGFPHIISELCERLGCAYTAQDNLLPTMTPFYAKRLQDTESDEDDEVRDERPPPPPPRQVSSAPFQALARRSDIGELLVRVRRIEERQDQLFSIIERMAARQESMEHILLQMHSFAGLPTHTSPPAPSDPTLFEHEQPATHEPAHETLHPIIKPVD